MPALLRPLFAPAAALLLAACAAPPPEVTKTVSVDAEGREVSHYRICERRGPPLIGELIGEAACRTETVVHNYCYRSLGRVDCYAQPLAGRTVMKVGE